MRAKLGPLQVAIIVLTLTTAVIHLSLGIVFIPDTLGYIFVLNSIAYIVLLAALYFVPQLSGMRSLVRWALLAFTAITFVLYFVFNWPNIWGLMGLITKADELLLMILLILDRNNN